MDIYDLWNTCIKHDIWPLRFIYKYKFSILMCIIRHCEIKSPSSLVYHVTCMHIHMGAGQYFMRLFEFVCGKWIHWWHHNMVIMSLQAIRLQYSHKIKLLFDKLFHVFLINYLENISLKRHCRYFKLKKYNKT
jgi:hypothetical protein